MTNTIWKCEQLRAGKLYNSVTFNSRQEADDFVAQMRRVEPDLFWRVEAIPASAVWN